MAEPSRSGALVVEATVIQLEEVPPGKRCSTVFKLHNTGSRRLVINQLAVGACCGNVVHDSLILPPHTTREWSLDIQAPFEPGPFKVTTKFTSSDPKHPRFELVANGVVRQGPLHAAK